MRHSLRTRASSPFHRTVACAVLYSIVAVAAVAPHLLSVGASQVGLVRASTAVSGVVHWATPTLVGWSNSSQPLGSNFWFPSISIATGLNGTVAQHITLSGDGGTCPPAGHPQSCEQIMVTRDGGITYTVVKRLARGTSGNFNGYGDLGTHVPAAHDAVPPHGEFDTLVGCNDCDGGALEYPMFKQTWRDDGKSLTVVKNVTIAFKGSPASFSKSNNCPGTIGGAPRACGFQTPSQTIIRTANDNLLLAVYGYAEDSVRKCRGGLCYTTAFYSSADDGMTWQYESRIDQTEAMPTAVEGPCEPSMVRLSNGSVLVLFRLTGGVQLWQARSDDNGKTWSTPTAARGCAGVGHDPTGVWPQLLPLSNGALTLATGRPGITFWTSPGATADCWDYTDVIAEHNKLVPKDVYDASSGSTSYCGVAEVAPGVVLLAYDKIGAGRVGALQKVYSVRVSVNP